MHIYRDSGREKQRKNHEELDRIHQRNFEKSKLKRQILVVEYFW